MIGFPKRKAHLNLTTGSTGTLSATLTLRKEDKYNTNSIVMNKLLTAVLCAMTIATYGQKNIFDIGIEGGFSIASLRGEINNNYRNSRIGYSGGFFVQYNFNEVISMRTGGFYERKGSSLELPATDPIGNVVIGTIHGKENFDYLTIPLLLRVSFGKNLNYNYFVNAGPYIGFLIKQTEYKEAFQGYPSGSNLDRTGNFKKIEMGLSFGLGLAYTFNDKFALSIEVRNNLGMTDITEVNPFGYGEIKTNAINFLLGFNYKLGQRKSNMK